jgi:hypothetical protein
VALLLAGMLMLSTATSDLEALAEQAGVEVQDLEGAVNSLEEAGLDADPYNYLVNAGHLKLLVPPAPPAVAYGIWDRLADCESGNGGRPGSANWRINAYHDGGLQFLPSTWTANKPAGYPAYAYQASREQQIHVGQIVQRRYGWGQWPVCSRRIGLR